MLNVTAFVFVTFIVKFSGLTAAVSFDHSFTIVKFFLKFCVVIETYANILMKIVVPKFIKEIGILRPITLYPFPVKPIADLAARGVKGFLVAELNAGQMVEDVRLAVDGKTPVEHYGRMGGMLFTPEELLQVLKDKLIK